MSLLTGAQLEFCRKYGHLTVPDVFAPHWMGETFTTSIAPRHRTIMRSSCALAKRPFQNCRNGH